MVRKNGKPELIVIAGPNGAGKTSVTQKFLHHEWADGTVYINPDEVAKEKFGDWNSCGVVGSGAGGSPFISGHNCFLPILQRLQERKQEMGKCGLRR